MEKCFMKIVMALAMLMLSVSALAQVCFDASDGRYVKFISDRGIGVSLYEKGRFCDALPYLESAHSLCPLDSVLNEYLYFSYKNTLRELDANRLYSSIPSVSVAKYGLKPFKPIVSIYAEGGVLFANDKTYWDDSYIYFERYVVGNGGFFSLDATNQIGSICELSHHFGVSARTNPVEMKGANKTYFNLRSKYVGVEYELNAKFNINEHWKVAPIFRVGHEAYDVVSFALDTTSSTLRAMYEPSEWGGDGNYNEWFRPAPQQYANQQYDPFNQWPTTNQWGDNPWGWGNNWGNSDQWWWQVDYPVLTPDRWKELSQTSYKYLHNSYRHTRNDILVGCRADYTYGRHLGQAGFSFFRGENLKVIQCDLSYRYYPLGNVNLFLSPKISYIWRGNDYVKMGDLPGSFLAEVEAGGKIYKRLWGSAAFLYGNLCDYHDRESHTLYTLSCETKFRGSAQLIYLLNNHLNVIVTYKYLRKKSNLYLVDMEGNSGLKPFGQNDNVIAIGAQWNF